jgi:hypothetical protein
MVGKTMTIVTMLPIHLIFMMVRKNQKEMLMLDPGINNMVTTVVVAIVTPPLNRIFHMSRMNGKKTLENLAIMKTIPKNPL